MNQDHQDQKSVSEKRRPRLSYDLSRRTTLAQGLKAARQRAGLSAREAAELLAEHGLECKRGTLLAWERGGGRTSREPFASDLAIVAKLYHCAVSDFFAGDQPPASNGQPDANGPRALYKAK